MDHSAACQVTAAIHADIELKILREWRQIPASLPALLCFSVMSCQQSRWVCSDHRYWCYLMCHSNHCSQSCCHPNYRRKRKRTSKSIVELKWQTFNITNNKILWTTQQCCVHIGCNVLVCQNKELQHKGFVQSYLQLSQQTDTSFVMTKSVSSNSCAPFRGLTDLWVFQKENDIG